MVPGRRLKLSLALAFLCLLSASASAQTGSAYGLDDVLDFVKGGLSTSAVLSRARNSCISFKVTQSVADRLRGAGANEALIDGLRGACYKPDSKGGDTGGRTTPRDAPRPTPSKPKKEPIRKNVTPVVPVPVPVQPTVYTPPLNNTSNNAIIDWNFRTSQPLTSGHFNNCQYDYSPAGYTVRVLEYGGSCLDGWTQEWEANIRVSTEATPVSGAAGYTYGLRFGITDDTTVGYYALEVSTYGHFQISRYRYSKWEVLVPWQNGSGINATTSNRITADIRGSVVAITINGINQYTYQAAAPVRGRAGFGIIGFDKEGPFPTVTFADFSVSGEKAAAPPPITPTVVPTAPVVSASGGIQYDFRTARPLSTGRYGNCQYDYTPAGYAISIADTAGYICLDGPLDVQPANVRVAATSLVTSSGSGLMYGLRFGYASQPATDYYLFELDESNRVKLSRYHQGRWDALLQWQPISGVHSPSSGIPNTLAAQITGPSVTLWVNGAQVGSYRAAEDITGKAGFGITGYSGALPTVTFSNFSVTPLAVPAAPVTPAVTPSTGAIYYDFSAQQPLTSGLYGKCRYEYTNGGYTVSVDQPGSTCIDGPAGDRPASIRVSTTARGLRGGTGYTYGLRLGYTSDQNVGYYAYEISEGGNFQLSRYRQNAWEVLIPWTSTSAVNAASAGIPNEIAAEIRGTSIVLFANGAQVGTYQASTPPVGPAGFGIIGYSQTLALPAVVFTKFSITPLY